MEMDKYSVVHALAILVIILLLGALYAYGVSNKAASESGISGTIENALGDATITVKTSDGLKDVTVIRSVNKSFQIPLAPGTYLLEASPETGMMPRPFAEPKIVDVKSGEFTNVTIVFNLGPR